MPGPHLCDRSCKRLELIGHANFYATHPQKKGYLYLYGNYVRNIGAFFRVFALFAPFVLSPILAGSPKLTLEAISDAFSRPLFEFRRIIAPLFCGLLDAKSQFNASLER